MKKKLPVWLIELLGIVISFLVAALGGFIFDSLKAETLAYIFIIPSLFAFWGFVIALVVHGIKAAVRFSTRKHQDLDIKKYAKIDPGTSVDGKTNRKEVYIYNRHEDFSFSKSTAPLSWGAIFLMLFLLYPIGVYFLIVKTTQEKGRCYHNGAVLQVVGLFLLLINAGLVFLFYYVGADNKKVLFSVISLPAVTALFCLIFIIYGSVLKRRGTIDDLCRRLITVDQVSSMDEIASRLHTDYSGACETVERLIDVGLLGNAYLSHVDREVIVPGISQKIVRRCIHCGGTTVLFSNEPMICDYCGGAL